MRCRVLSALFFIFCLITFALVSYAHPGRTDANGGHYDHSTGEYHYHHGYSAHFHIDGVCPYDYHDNTDHDQSSYMYSSRHSDYPRPTPTNNPARVSTTNASDSSSSFSAGSLVLAGFGVAVPGVLVLRSMRSRKRRHWEHMQHNADWSKYIS